jgi:hypothetical protein
MRSGQNTTTGTSAFVFVEHVEEKRFRIQISLQSPPATGRQPPASDWKRAAGFGG